MTGEQKNRRSIVQTADVTIGDESTRLSSFVFLLLCIIPIFSTILFGGVDTTTWIFISVFWAVISLLWFVEAWKANGILINTNVMQIPLAGLILIGLIQMLPLGGGSSQAGIAVSHALSLDPYSTRFFVVRLVVYLVFFAACLTVINNEARVKKAVVTAIIFGSVMAFYGILQRLANPDGIYGVRATPQAIPFGPFVNQHHFAAFMQLTGGLTLGLLMGKRTEREKRVLYATAFVIMGAAAVLTSSRGGLLGFVAMAALVTVLNLMSGRWTGKADGEARVSAQRKIALAASGLALIAVIVCVVLFLGGNDALLRGTGVSNNTTDLTTGRAHFWPVAVSIFLEHPIIGAGLDAFGVAFTKFDTWNGMLRVEQAHNEYLQTLADAGIAGFICVAAFIYFLFRKGIGNIVTAIDFPREAAVGALAGCFGILIHSFFDFPLRTPSNAFFFLMLCAIATVPIAATDEKSRRQPSPI